MLNSVSLDDTAGRSAYQTQPTQSYTTAYGAWHPPWMAGMQAYDPTTASIVTTGTAYNPTSAATGTAYNPTSAATMSAAETAYNPTSAATMSASAIGGSLNAGAGSPLLTSSPLPDYPFASDPLSDFGDGLPYQDPAYDSGTSCSAGDCGKCCMLALRRATTHQMWAVMQCAGLFKASAWCMNEYQA